MSDFEDYDNAEDSIEGDIDTMEFASDMGDTEIDVDAEPVDGDDSAAEPRLQAYAHGAG